MKKLHISALSSVAALAVLAGCTATEPMSSDSAAYLSDARLGPKADKICFKNDINDFRGTTNTTVILERGVKDYLIQTVDDCNELAEAQSVSIDNFETSGCVSERDYIMASGSRFGADESAPSSRCRIAAIYEWNEDAAQSKVASTD